MKEQNDISEKDSQLLSWLNNFMIIFQESAPAFGIKPAEIAVLKGLVSDVVNDLNQKRSPRKTVEKDALLRFILSFIDRMKGYPDYEKRKLDDKMNTQKLRELL